jgi:hypothetical protein
MKVESRSKLEQVLRGLVQDWSQLEALDRAFATLLQDAREVSEKSFTGGPPPDWDEKWKQLESTLNLVRAHAAKTREILKSPERAAADTAPLDEWKEIGRLDSTIESLLDSLKQASEPPPDARHRQEWENCWAALLGYLKAMRAHTAAVAVKLEMQLRYGGEEANRLTAAILSRLPVDPEQLVGPEAFEKVAYELHVEHHQFKGFWDAARALLMYWETPDERIAKH